MRIAGSCLPRGRAWAAAADQDSRATGDTIAMRTGPTHSPKQKSQSKGRERRRAKREALGTRGQLIRCPASSRTAPIDVQFSDRSSTGVGIVHHEPLPIGQKVV